MESMEGEATVKGLTPDTTYYFLLAAKNGGSGGIGDTHTKRLSAKTDPAPRPAQVTGIGVTPGDMKLTVSWDAANPDVDANRTNHIITMYWVQYRESQTVTNNPGDWMPTKPMEVPGTTTEITGLTNDMSYDVQVKAVNDATGVSEQWSAQSPRSQGTPMAGTGTPPTTPPPTTPPPTTSGAPTGKPAVEVTVDSHSGDRVTVSWTAVERATKYMVEWRTAAQTYGFEDRQMEVMGNGRTTDIDDLEYGMEYMFRVLAGNDAGYGPASDEAKATPTAPAYISRPTNLRVDPGDMMVMASWGKPKVGADLVAGYHVQTRSTPGSTWEEKDAGMVYEFTYEGLTNGVAYDVWVCPYDGDDVVDYAHCAEAEEITPMAPVPALPIFGAVALGAGLLAAGRARLRRRELRAGRVQRQINR